MHLWEYDRLKRLEYSHLLLIGSHAAYEQVMAAVSDFEKGNMRLSVVLASLEAK